MSYHFSWNGSFISRVETKMHIAIATSSSELSQNDHAETP